MGIQQRRLARGNALRFRHVVGDELVFFVVGVGRTAILSDRQRVDQDGVGCAFDGLEQRGQECCQLIAGVLELLHLAQVNRQLVEQNQCRLTTEQLAQGLGTRSDAAFVALAHPRIPILASKCISDLTPRGCKREDPASILRPLAGSAFSPSKAAIRTWLCGRREGSTNSAIPGTPCMPRAAWHKRDQPVGFTAAVGGVEPENRRDFTTRTHQPPGTRWRAGS